MARQNTAPVQFRQSVRTEQGVLMSSGYAGVVQPVCYFPLLRGDSGAGRVSLDLSLAEMPRPLLNAVFVNVQAWFISKAIHPQFNGTDEFAHSYTKQPMKALGAADRTPPPFFMTVNSDAVKSSSFYKSLGIHLPAATNVSSDIIDAFVSVYNFRLQAHSSKMTRKKYASEDLTDALTFPRAFWPSGRFANVVPDYERALIVGSLDLDVAAGRLPVKNLHFSDATAEPGTAPYTSTDTGLPKTMVGSHRIVRFDTGGTQGGSPYPKIWAEMAGETVTTSLADIDMARKTQAFAKLRASMAGNDVNGFVSDEVILAHLMQGLSVPPDMFARPQLLDSQRVPVGFTERFSTDATALDASVTTGQTSVSLSLNIPKTDHGGIVLVTIEVLPERLDEAQSDEWLMVTDPDELPNALRDIQNPEPVDYVLNRRIDARHTVPTGIYGFEPMNDKYNRTFTRLGGVFFQPNPADPFKEQRAGIWQAPVVDPVFSQDHWLAPAPFPHYVFADTAAPAFEFVVRHNVKIVGNTQIGDVLVENNDDWAAVDGTQAEV